MFIKGTLLSGQSWKVDKATAVRMAEAGQFDHMVAWTPPTMSPVPLEDAIRCRKHIDLNSDKVLTARSIGICLGDKES